MALIDIIFLIVLGGFALFGFWFGLLHTLGSLLGTLLGVFLASRWYDDVALWAHNNFAGSLNVWSFISFIFLFLLINRLIGFLFHLIERFFDLVSVVPFLKSINRITGTALGALEGAVVIGMIVFVADKFPFNIEEKLFAASILKGYFLTVFNILLPLIPEALKVADVIIKQ